MSSTNRQKLRNLRCSTRQVTKRPFHLSSSQPSPHRVVQPSPRHTVQLSPHCVVQPSPRRTVQPSPHRVVQPSPRHTVQPSPNRSVLHLGSLGNANHSQSAEQTVTTRVSPIAAYVIKDAFKVPINKSHQDVAELSRSSPLAMIIEHDENAEPNPPDSDGTGPPDVAETRQAPTQKKQVLPRKSRPPLPAPEETPPPGDVSVSFLASTPKPGQPQLSRRRPFSATREVGKGSSTLSDTSRNSSRRSESVSGVTAPQTSTRKRKLSQSKQKLHQGKQHSRRVFSNLSSQSRNVSQQHTESISSDPSENVQPDISDASDTNRTITRSSSRIVRDTRNKNEDTRSSSRIATKRNVSDSRTQTDDTVEDTRSSSRIATKQNVSDARNQTEDTVEEATVNKGRKRSRDQTRDQNLSEETTEVDGIAARKIRRTTRTSLESVTNASKSEITASVTSKPTSYNETNSLAHSKGKQKKPSDKASNVKAPRGRRNPIYITVAQNATAHDDSDSDSSISQLKHSENVTQYDMSSSDESTSTVTRKRTRKTSVAEKKKMLNSHRSGLEAQKGGNVTIGDIDGVKRLKNIVDMDVIVNDFTDILTSEMSNCESRREETAMKLLEKYLVQDITTMIKDVYTVKTLQARVKKMNQRVAQRKEELLRLQTQSIELDKSTGEQNLEVSENMARINQCLADLKTLVDLC